MTSWLPKTIAKTAWSCRFASHNIRKIRHFLKQHAAQLLVQALVISRLDYCNALLAGLPSCKIKPLQMIQNAAAWLVFSEPKRAHVTPLFISLHWLPVAARIKFKTLMLAYRTSTGSTPFYFHSLITIYKKSEICERASPRGTITERHKITLQNVFIHRSWLVEWTSHPHPECWIPDDFQATPENSSLPSSLDFILKKIIIIIIKKTPSLSFLNFALFPLTSHCLARICSEQCLEICITSTSCVCFPLYNVSLIVFLNCKSLRIG